jgi:predicted site-specific integrase-resolvase
MDLLTFLDDALSDGQRTQAEIARDAGIGWGTLNYLIKAGKIRCMPRKEKMVASHDKDASNITDQQNATRKRSFGRFTSQMGLLSFLGAALSNGRRTQTQIARDAGIGRGTLNYLIKAGKIRRIPRPGKMIACTTRMGRIYKL